MDMRNLLKQNEKLRNALRQLNNQIANILKQKAVKFKPKIAPSPIQKNQDDRILVEQLDSSRKMINNLKHTESQLSNRLSSAKQQNIHFDLMTAIARMKELIEQAKKNVKELKRSEQLRSKIMTVDYVAEWPVLLPQLHKLNNKHTQLTSTLRSQQDNKRSLQTQNQRADEHIRQLDSEIQRVQWLQSQLTNQSKLQQQQARLKKSIESMSKIVRSAKENTQREYLKMLQEIDCTLQNTNAITQRIETISNQVSNKNLQVSSIMSQTMRTSKGDLQSALQSDKRRNQSGASTVCDQKTSIFKTQVESDHIKIKTISQQSVEQKEDILEKLNIY